MLSTEPLASGSLVFSPIPPTLPHLTPTVSVQPAFTEPPASLPPAFTSPANSLKTIQAPEMVTSNIVSSKGQMLLKESNVPLEASSKADVYTLSSDVVTSTSLESNNPNYSLDMSIAANHSSSVGLELSSVSDNVLTSSLPMGVLASNTPLQYTSSRPTTYPSFVTKVDSSLTTSQIFDPVSGATPQPIVNTPVSAYTPGSPNDEVSCNYLTSNMPACNPSYASNVPYNVNAQHVDVAHTVGSSLVTNHPAASVSTPAYSSAGSVFPIPIPSFLNPFSGGEPEAEIPTSSVCQPSAVMPLAEEPSAVKVLFYFFSLFVL